MSNNKEELFEPMIFEDQQKKENKELVRPMEFDVRTKSVEEKLFIILYVLEEDNLEKIYQNCYSICQGRTEAYSDIKSKLISGLNINVHKSKIITETKQTESETGDRKYYLIPLDECLSVYSFCISVSDFYSDDEFNIDDYVSEDDDSADTDKIIQQQKNSYSVLEELDSEYRKLLEQSIKRENFLRELGKDDGINV